jgi:polysaccharide export outer membrane protein
MTPRPAPATRVVCRCCIIVLVAGAIGAIGRPSAAQHPAGSPSAAQQPDSTASLAHRAATARIQPGDRIVLRVWREASLSDTVTVDQNGEVVLPRLGPYSVASHAIGSLQDSLRRRYAEFLRNPSIGVTVLRRVGVHGEVKQPNLYWVDVTMTLRDVIAAAGGVTEDGNANKVVIVRGGTEIKIGRWERGGLLAGDLLSGDQIVVDRRSWLSRNALAAVSALGVVVSIFVTALRSP